MPAYQPPEGRSWRQPHGPAPAAPPPARPAPVTAGGRGAKVAAALAFFAFVGLLIWAATWLDRPRPVRVVLLAAGYEQNLAVPHNVPGRGWAEDLAGLSAGGPLRGFHQVADGGPVELRTGTKWDAGLRGARERTVVVAFAAHGGADADGAYLLPTDAAPGPGPANRLRVAAVLDRLAELPAGSSKVLVLDAARVPANPLFGMLRNDFAAGLDRLAGKIEATPNLVVLSAGGPADTAGGRPGFGHFLVRGLSGEADANGDRRVTLAELHAFLGDRAPARPVLYPTGPEGERRAKGVTVALLPADYTPPPAAEAKPFDPPPALRAAWDRHRELAEIDPHPAAAAPHAWRVYEARLVRYEQLLAAGDERAAAEAARRLAAAEQDLLAAGRVELKSADATLATAAVAEAGRAFDAVWGAPAEKEKAAVEEWLKGNPRAQYHSLLIDRVIADPAANLTRAAALARRIDDPGRVRPAEVHFLLMLALHLPAGALPARAELVAAALRVRRVAERAAIGHPAYAERLHPWVGPRLRPADEARAEAEDRLFSPAAADLKPAAELFAKAEAAYTALLAEADRVRAGLRAYDRLTAVLPGLAAWAADHPDPATTAAAEALWRGADALAARLNPAAPTDALPDAAKDLEARLDALVRQARQEAAALLPAPPAGVSPAAARRSIDRLLTVPHLEPGSRPRLLALAARLAGEAGDGPAAEGDSPGPAPDRLGRLALAELGPATPDAAREALGSKDPAAAGPPLGDRLARLPADVRRLADRARTSPPAAARTAIAEAAALSRAVPAGLAIQPPEPAVALRHVRLQDFLVAQAGRAAAGAWVGENNEPYARTLALAYLGDAGRLDLADVTREEAAAARAAANRPLDLALAATPRTAVTDPGPFAVEAETRGTARPDVFPGRVAVWGEPGAGVAVTAGAASGPAFGTHRYRFDLDSPKLAAADALTPAGVATAVTVRGFFRGRELAQPAGIDLYPVPDLTVRVAPPPPGVGVAVRAGPDVLRRYGAGDGAVAVVLDCSGSMAAAPGRPADEARIKVGAKAVARLVAKMPRGTAVSVWAFGQAGDAGKRVDAAERTVRRVLDPVQWDPDNAELLAGLAARLDRLEPYNESPLFRALLSARDDVLSAPGYRAVVVVTDGGDNRFAADRQLNPDGRPPRAVLREKLRDGGVVVHAAGFEPRTADEGRGRDELKDVIEGLPVPGRFVGVDEVDDLAEHLRQALSPRLRVRLTPADAPGGREVALDVGTGGADDRWAGGRVGPGRYFLSAPGITLPAEVRLAAGDYLMVSLAATARGPEFRRPPFAADYPWKPAAESDRGDWRVAALQNQLTKAGGLRMLATLEKTTPPAGDPLRVVRPGEVWFEVGTDLETTAAAAVRVAPAWGYPAPAWDISAPAWPAYAATGTAARPVLRAWWADAPPRGVDVPLADLLAGKPLAVTVGADAVNVTAALERQPAVAGEPARSAPAVVVRVAHPPGRPVVARLDGIAADEYEHRLFSRAARYTGVFWAAGDPRAATVRLVPLDDFKAAARRVELRDLKPPDPNDDRPRPVDAPPPAGR